MDRVVAVETYCNGKKIAHTVYDDYPIDQCKKNIEHAENGMMFITYTAAVAQ